MNIFHSILFFGIPGLFIYLGTYFLVPVLITNGWLALWAWFFCIWGPIAILLVIILWRFFHFKNRSSFSTRFRFQRIEKKDYLIILAAFIALQILELLLSPSGQYLAQFAFFAPPDGVPELFNPEFNIETGLTYFFGYPTYGQWWLLGYWLLWLLINIGGEEIVWRGYALPLQEKIFAKWAWLVNGLCWNLLVHFFMNWNLVALMPVSLIIPYLVQKYQNTWIGIILHGLGNLLLLALLIPAIMTPPS